MSIAELQAILPLLVLTAGALVIMLLLSIKRRQTWSCWLTVAVLGAAALASLVAQDSTAVQVTPLLRNDHYSAFFSALFCISGALTAVISRDYLRTRPGQNEEYYLLLLLSTMGAVTLAYATHLASLLLGLELLGVALYALIAYPDRGELPLEAAVKYLVLSGAASATLLFGFALLYAALGTLDYAGIGSALARTGDSGHQGTLLLAGAAMIFAGAGFKLSAVPFHMWTPDVYEGAPAPIGGFLAAVSKAAVFVAVMRWFLDSELYRFEWVHNGIAALAGASILVGNLLALLQNNVKRVLAYSSIGHMGYLLVILLACGLSPDPGFAVEAGSFYVVTYVVTTLAVFTLLGLMSRGEEELTQRSELAGLFWRDPLLAGLFSVGLLSLAGIPLTVGFIGKFYLISVGVEAELWILLALVVVGSTIGIFYYLRIIYSMAQADTADRPQPLATSQLVSCGLIFAMLYLGVLPQTLMNFLRYIL